MADAPVICVDGPAFCPLSEGAVRRSRTGVWKQYWYQTAKQFADAGWEIEIVEEIANG